MPSARPRRWIQRTSSTSSTLQARRASPRASFTLQAATSRRSRPRPSGSSTLKRTTSTGARPTSAGLQGTPTLSTGPLATGRPPSSSRVRRATRAPTVIRAFMKQGTEPIEKHDLSSLRLLGSVGEPINPRAWEWYHENIGGGRCPIVDTWWQTETGMILITPLPGVTTTKPGSATRPFPTIKPDIYDEDGNPVEDIGEGTENAYLVLKRPWPAMFRTLYKDPQRYKESYWEVYDGVYFVGDGARRDEDGYYWITGRVDDVMNGSGHRISTIEVENALVSHEAVAESAVIGRHDEDKGQAIFAYVSLEGDREGSDELKSDLRQHVRRRIGPIATPDEMVFTNNLPKTRSGKIMRRILRTVAEGSDDLGDTSTLADPSSVDALQEEAAQQR